jgi:hypothetical protein
MSFLNFFHASYWFNQPLIARGWIFTVWLCAFLGIFLAGLVAFFLSQRQSFPAQSRWFARLAHCLLTMGFVALVWLGLRQERIPFLAWRFWILLWLILLIVWLVKLGLYAVKRLPEIKREHAERAAREKYLTKGR